MRGNFWVNCSLLIGIAGVGLAIYQAYDLLESRGARVRHAKQAAQQEAARAADEIDQELRQSRAVADSLAEDLTSGRLAPGELDGRLKAIVVKEKEILTVGVAYDPSVSSRLNTAVFTGRGDSARKLRLEDLQDYTAPEVLWYNDAIREGQGWRTPSWNETEESTTVVYSAPFSPPAAAARPGPAGVVFVSVSLDRVKERVDELDTGRLGWGGVLSRDGRYLVHPNEQRVEESASLLELLDARGDDEFLAVIKRALSGESVNLERADTTTGQTGWFFHEPVKETGWSVVVARFEDEVLVTGRPFRRRVISIAVTAVIGLICLAGWISGAVYSRRPKQAILWALVAFASLVMIAGMDVIRRVTYEQVSDEERDAVKILGEDSLSSFVRSQRALWVSRHEQPPVTVPTGILVRTLAFTGPKEVFVTGVIWQKFTAGKHDAVSRGIDFPDAIQHELSEAYRRKRDSVETVGWRFEATLRQIMDLKRYPLDHDNVAIRLLPKDYDSRVILVPDLVSYTMINPNARPGLEETIELSGWIIDGSYFDYKYSNYNTDLGIPDYEGEESLPELHFNIQLKRHLLNAAISTGIPVLVVLLMLFAIVVKKTGNVDESKLFGFNPSGVMRISSALFFVVLLAHIQLRRGLQAEEVVFLDYLYFTVYLALLSTALHTFLAFSNNINLPIIEYKESLIVKLLFWPAILALQLLIMIAVFY